MLVRSKSEVIVAETLHRLGVSYEYEKPLPAHDNPRDFRFVGLHRVLYGRRLLLGV